MTIGVGVVGCGLIGTKRSEATAGVADVRTVFDIDSGRSETLAARLHGSPRVARDLDEVLAADDVDLVFVATTHDVLASTALRAIDAAKHVLIEKPGAASLDPLLKLAAAAQGNDRIVRVGYNHRFHPAPRHARELVAERPLESLLYIRGRYGHGGRLGYEKEWRADRSRSGGGELIDQGSHLIDLVRFLVGDVDLRFAELTTSFWAMAVEDNAYLALRPARGGMAWLHASWTEWKNLFSLELALSRCKLELAGLGGSYGTETLTVHEMTEEMGPPPARTWSWPGRDDSWRLEVLDVIQHIKGGDYIGATLEDAIAVMTVIDEAYRT
jgi:predicted dehydrogenase